MRIEELSPGTECLLKPERNMYWDDERHKWSEIANNWNCLYCGKSFYNEQFLDKHYDNRHASTVLTVSKSLSKNTTREEVWVEGINTATY